MNYKDYIAIIEDFPKKGISFKDITPLIGNGEVLNQAIGEMAEFAKEVGANVVVGPESRGFIFGCPVSSLLKIGFVPVRKPGKLPRETVEVEYALEYGTNKIQMHKDAVKPGDKVVICDDLLATGGTVEAAVKLIESCGAKVVGCCFVVELTGLNGREKLAGIPTKSLVTYEF